MSQENVPIPPTLDYASPKQEKHVAPCIIKVDGKTIISTIPMRLPKRCVKCNDEGAVRLTKLFSLPASAGLKVQVTGHFSYCRKHYRERALYLLRYLLIGLSIFALNAMMFAVSVNGWFPEYIAFFFFVGAFVWPALYGVIAFRRSRVLVIKHIDNRWMWINGAGEPFLESLRAETVSQKA